MRNLLEKYHKKRDFKQTSEPKGKVLKTNHFRFVIQKHDARNLHYDFRFEHDGVLKSWAVPKGLPYQNSDKRLAVHVEDHPLHYFDFEGNIPEGNYGAGGVLVWDSGNYWVPHAETQADVNRKIAEGFEKGEIKLILNGRKVKGLFALVRFKKAGENGWLFIKDKDEFDGKNFYKNDVSVKSGKTLKQIEEKSIKESKKKNAIISPMFAESREKPFDDENFLFEEKLDGYRTISFLSKGDIQLRSRRGESLNKKFSDIEKALKKIKYDCVLDGEVVAYDNKGKTSFQAIQNKEDKDGVDIKYHIFDILNFNGVDTTKLPLIERKKFLKKIFPNNTKKIILTKFIRAHGKEFFQNLPKSSEGMMAKKMDSIYLVGERSRDWYKIKKQKRQEFVIGGITNPKGNRKGFGSLIVGYYKNNKLEFCGHIGTGFDQNLIDSLMKVFEKIEVKDSPFENYKKGVNLQFWVKPILVCEATFAEWTDDKMIRQASFVGIRTDKLPHEAEKETVVSEKLLNVISNPEKIYFNEKKITKLDLAKFYLEISAIILPYLRDRPQNLNRHPNGYKEMNFYQKDIEFELPEYIQTFDVKRDKPKEESNKSGFDKEITYILCQNTETLLYMTNLGCIEINPWLSRIQSLDKPDFMIFDIDPNGVNFSDVVRIVKELNNLLEKLDIYSAIKTSGKRGIHLYTNVAAQYSHEETRSFAEAIAKIMETNFPELISLERSPKNRKNKIYIDYLQNRQGQTTASVYSARPTKFASVSTPIEISELNSKLDPTKFDIKNTLKRVEKKGDLWAKLFENEVNLSKALKLLENII